VTFRKSETENTSVVTNRFDMNQLNNQKNPIQLNLIDYTL
jgi:hypothetical protein